MGFGANWITDWYSYDSEATAILGLGSAERVAGFVMIGTPKEPPQERERPVLDPLVTRWSRESSPDTQRPDGASAPPGLR
jgi:nitroreductase